MCGVVLNNKDDFYSVSCDKNNKEVEKRPFFLRKACYMR
jgi:hypothetical protein